MNAQQETALSVLRDLIETARDGQEGFRKASESVADDPELKMLLSSLSLQRAKFAGELESQAIAMGEPRFDQGPSLPGAAHRWWMGLRASVTRGDNHAILAECERGEDAAKEAYNRAMEDELPDPVREIVNRQRREVLAAHNTIRALRDATPGSAAQLIAAAKARTEQAAADASEAWARTRSKARRMSRKARGFVRRNPLAILGGLLLVGLAAGLVSRGLKMRNKRFGFGFGMKKPWLGRARERAWMEAGRMQGRMEHFLPRRRFADRLRNAWRDLEG